MRFIERTAPGTLSLNYMWLPTWIGMNAQLLRELEEVLTTTAVGKPLTDDLLDDLQQELLDVLMQKFPSFGGLRDYLDGVKFVGEYGATG